MTIKEAQQEVDNWIKNYGVRYFNELTNLAILMEEVGEFSKIMSRKYGEQSFKENETKDPKGELGDILFVLICLANQMNISLEDCLKQTIEKNTKRDFKRHKQNQKLE